MSAHDPEQTLRAAGFHGVARLYGLALEFARLTRVATMGLILQPRENRREI